MNAMEKLVALWPKGSEWKPEALSNSIEFFQSGHVPFAVRLFLDGNDTQNAPARNIIEDALIELGYKFFSWGHEDGAVTVVASTPTISAHGKGASKTEALLDLAVKVLEAHAPHP